MALDGLVSSPHRRSQNTTAFSMPSNKKQYAKPDDLSCSVLLQRHRYLLTALALLAVLCTVYLYFAVTLVPGKSCAGLTGKLKESCNAELAKAAMGNGKLKFL
ncbi:uncharacterized protein LOC124945708 [Impatiens glandulifera]|uniref:uncharacterized protein LOC124945708 n=1 Tax=Impatiens glandulifera TaxID=253017 RepID=UPI001FB0BDCA|nr:uncharacterized protein LOC124945708 [Impatiens glandulifera]